MSKNNAVKELITSIATAVSLIYAIVIAFLLFTIAYTDSKLITTICLITLTMTAVWLYRFVKDMGKIKEL